MVSSTVLWVGLPPCEDLKHRASLGAFAARRFLSELQQFEDDGSSSGLEKALMAFFHFSRAFRPFLGRSTAAAVESGSPNLRWLSPSLIACREICPGEALSGVLAALLRRLTAKVRVGAYGLDENLP